MPFYFNKTSRDNCAILRGFLSDKDSAYFDILAGRLIKSEDIEGTYYLIAYCSKIETLINIEDKSWKFSPCNVILSLHNQEFTRRVKNKETNQYEEKEQKPVACEIAFIDYVTKTFGDKIFGGEVEFSDSRIAVEYLRDGEHPKIDRLFDLRIANEKELVDEDQQFLLDAIKPKNGQSGRTSGYTAKSVQQIYEERLQAVIEAVKPYSTGATDPINLAFGLQALKDDSKEVYEITMQLLSMLLK
jgi:hypothetical protein